MRKIKRFVVFTLFSLFFSLFGGKVVQAAYRLTLKPKFHCAENNVLVQGECVPDGEDIGS